MPEYINPNSFTVHLTGPDGVIIKMKGYTKMILSDHFDKYRARGFIKLLSSNQMPNQAAVKRKPQSKINISRIVRQHDPKRKIKKQEVATRIEIIQESAQTKLAKERRQRRQEIAKVKKISRGSDSRRKSVIRRGSGHRDKMIVGKRLAIDATELLKNNLKKDYFPISNNIGIGIMSYQREDILRRLIDSIIKHTDLRKTTVFISDDGSDDPGLVKYLSELADTNNFVVLKNPDRIGIAGNSNRLIRCLTRFKYGMILNDDVEILRNDWEYYYVDAMRRTGMHHFLYRQVGVYGAKIGDSISIGEINLRKVDEKPHGAVMAFTREMLVKCGYFNESYGIYGMEHVDWSQKVWEMGLQEKGFFDVEGSNNFFHIHGGKSAVEDKEQYLREARKLFKNRSPTRLGPTDKSKVPEITYVIPFRNISRNDSIITVINNIRAQRFPVVHIIMVEQDANTKIDIDDYAPVFYHLAQRLNPLFNKSIAFNVGVQKTSSDKVILHDADMLTQGHYSREIWKVLETFEACHTGGKVIYTTEDSARKINSSGLVDHDVQCERVVGYFEGGSLACRVSTYWKIGAFNEDFWGYGCEDCDFYARLSQFSPSKWSEDRNFDFLHLWHSRVSGWSVHHNKNKVIDLSLNNFSIDERIQMQHRQLKKADYSEELKKAIE